MFSLTGLRATQLNPQITAWVFLMLLPSQAGACPSKPQGLM